MTLFKPKPNRVAGKVVYVPISSISPSPHQPRRFFDQEGLDTLARSISQNGLLVPVSVRLAEDGYILIAGERRLRACRSLGMTEIPAVVLEKEDAQAAVLTLVENLHRENLDCFEEAMGILRLMQMEGVSQSQVCTMLGKSQPSVANKLRLLRLPPEVRQVAREAGMGERICRALLPLENDPETQLKVCRQIARRQMNASQAESYVASFVDPKTQEKRGAGTLRDFRLLFSSVDRAVEEIRRLGIDVKAEKSEDDQFVYYTIRVPKSTALADERAPRRERIG